MNIRIKQSGLKVSHSKVPSSDSLFCAPGVLKVHEQNVKQLLYASGNFTICIFGFLWLGFLFQGCIISQVTLDELQRMENVDSKDRQIKTSYDVTLASIISDVRLSYDILRTLKCSESNQPYNTTLVGSKKRQNGFTPIG